MREVVLGCGLRKYGGARSHGALQTRVWVYFEWLKTWQDVKQMIWSGSCFKKVMLASVGSKKFRDSSSRSN